MTVNVYERARFLVECHGETFTVDLLRFDLNGQCDCWPFKKYFMPAILDAKAAGSFVPGPRFRCPHIQAVRERMLELFLADLAQKFPDNTDTF